MSRDYFTFNIIEMTENFKLIFYIEDYIFNLHICTIIEDLLLKFV